MTVTQDIFEFRDARKERIREGLHILARMAGPRCPTFERGCLVCHCHHLIDTLSSLPGFELTPRRSVTTHRRKTTRKEKL